MKECNPEDKRLLTLATHSLLDCVRDTDLLLSLAQCTELGPTGGNGRKAGFSLAQGKIFLHPKLSYHGKLLLESNGWPSTLLGLFTQQ